MFTRQQMGDDPVLAHTCYFYLAHILLWNSGEELCLSVRHNGAWFDCVSSMMCMKTLNVTVSLSRASVLANAITDPYVPKRNHIFPGLRAWSYITVVTSWEINVPVKTCENIPTQPKQLSPDLHQNSPSDFKWKWETKSNEDEVTQSKKYACSYNLYSTSSLYIIYYWIITFSHLTIIVIK